jgi:hypothetical protein
VGEEVAVARLVPLHVGALLVEVLVVISVVSEGWVRVLPPLPLQEMQTPAVLEEWRAKYREKT